MAGPLRYDNGTVKDFGSFTANGSSDYIALRRGISDGSLPSTMSFQTVVTGGPTTITVSLEGSLDGQNWAMLAQSTSTTGEIVHVVNKAVPYMRFTISNLTGGASPAARIWFFAGS